MPFHALTVENAAGAKQRVWRRGLVWFGGEWVMALVRILFGLAATAAALVAAPASAQFYFKSPDVSGPPVMGDEPGIALNLPGATPSELRAGLVWQLRAALNIGALQCQFEPSLLTVVKYNAVLTDHQAELKASLDTLSGYFARKAKTKKAGQTALDQFGTRLYSSFSTVASQYLFCQTAAEIGYLAAAAPRGQLYSVAQNNMRALRNSLRPAGEQRFGGRNQMDMGQPRIANLDPRCWTRQNSYQWNICGWMS